MKNYEAHEPEMNIVSEPMAVYYSSASNPFALLNAIRNGIDFFSFEKLFIRLPFTLADWCKILHISDRTMQRYKKDTLSFDALQSEKILQIKIMYEEGLEVFGNEASLDKWLNTENLALGKKHPKEFMDSSFGIDMVKDELHRIATGVLA